MPLVVPAILAKSKKTFETKITNVALRELAPLWQVDVLDGSMFNSSCWAKVEDIASMGDLPEIELHLMVQNPLPIIRAWHEKISSLKRAIIHAEISRPIGAVIAKIRKLGIETGIAVNPETALNTLQGNIPPVDLLLIMGVSPGASGQKFLGEAIIKKIEEAKRRFREPAIGVDGGVKVSNAKALAAAGTSQLCVASALWKAKDKAATYHTLAED